MNGSGNPLQAPLAGVEPALLNAVAWERRWTSREDSTANAEVALRTAEKAGEERGRVAVGLAKRTLAWQAKWRGDFDASLKYCLEAEEHLSEVTHPAARADVYSILGVIHYSRNRLDLAGCAVQRGFHILENQDGTPSASAMVDLLATHATIQRYSGDNARVGITLGRALELASSQERSRIDQNIARWLIADGEYEKALEHSERSLTGAIESRNRVIMPYAYEVMGAALSRLRRYNEATEAFENGLEIGKADEDRRVQCQIVQEHGAMHMANGNPKAARDQFRKGARLAKGMGYGLWQRTFALGLADAYEKLGDLRAALDQHKAAWRLQKQAR